MQENNYLSEQLDYYRQHQHQPGWQNVAQVLFLGIQANAENEDARAFLHSIGAKLAQQQPLPLSQTVGELEDNINHLWASYHWGFVRIDANDREIRLTHSAWPNTDNLGDKKQWQIAFASFLAGIYGEWLSQQGGHPEVNAQWFDNEFEGPLTFRYKSGI